MNHRRNAELWSALRRSVLSSSASEPTLLIWPCKEQRGFGLAPSAPVSDVSALAYINGNGVWPGSSAACECGENEQAVVHVVIHCPIH